MKKLAVTLLAILFLSLSLCVFAENWSVFSDEQLRQFRNEINAELGSRAKDAAVNADDEAFLGKLIELFPDETLAMAVRDSLKKLSISQKVTQSELDSIKKLTPSLNGVISSLEGISHLRYLEELSVNYHHPGDGYAWSSKLTEIPDEICSLTQLRVLNLGHPCAGVAYIPENIGDLVNLEKLDISYTKIDHLPESIGSLTKLTSLDISYTPISELPDCVWDMGALEIKLTGSKVK